jgi:hydroxyacylglutathione hydrolase
MKIEKIVVGPLSTNCYLVFSDKEAIIIDPGDEAEKILKVIEKIKVKPKYIVLTHYHFDHVLAVEELREKTKAEVLIHEAEKKFIDFKVDKFLKEGDKIKIDNYSLRVIHTPGHSKGSICLLGKNEIFVGDLIFKNGYGRTDLPGGSNKDLERSLKRIYKLIKKGMVIYPGHQEEFKFEDNLKNEIVFSF